MDDLVSKLADMSWNEAHNHLMSLNLPLDLRVSLAASATKLRPQRTKARRRSKLTHAYHAEMWFRLIAPLKYDLSNAKVGLQLKPFDAAPERHKAFTDYVALLEKLLSGLQMLQVNESVKASAASFEAHARAEVSGKASTAEYAKTPAEIAVERGLSNKGEHWTDWINERTKQRIESLFDAIPTKAKRPKPFARRLPSLRYLKDVDAFQRRALTELELLDQEFSMLNKIEYCTREHLDRMDELKETRKRMVFALHYVHNKTDTAPIPLTWHGLKHRYYDEEESTNDEGGEREHREMVVSHLRWRYKMDKPEPKKPKTKRPKRYQK